MLYSDTLRCLLSDQVSYVSGHLLLECRINLTDTCILEIFGWFVLEVNAILTLSQTSPGFYVSVV